MLTQAESDNYGIPSEAKIQGAKKLAGVVTDKLSQTSSNKAGQKIAWFEYDNGAVHRIYSLAIGDTAGTRPGIIFIEGIVLEQTTMEPLEGLGEIVLPAKPTRETMALCWDYGENMYTRLKPELQYSKPMDENAYKEARYKLHRRYGTR